MFKKILRRLATLLVPFFGSLGIKLIYFTCKKTFHSPKELPQESCIVAFWHGNLLMQPLNYRKWQKKIKIVVMISEHFDGLLIANTMKYFSFDTIRGSSRSSAAKVLIQALKKVKAGYDLGITPDGPKGPKFSVSDGIVIIAQKLDRAIVVQNCVPSSYWELSSWDNFMTPKPFSHLEFYASEPFKVTGLSMEDAKALIYDKLMQHAIK